MSRRSLLLSLLVGLAVPSSAAAGTTSAWSPVTTATELRAQPAVARTQDGVLHVLWRAPAAVDPRGADDLRHTPVSPGGAVGPTTTLAAGWARIGEPSLVVAPDGSLRAMFAGRRTGQGDDPNGGLDTAAAPPDGALWSVAPSAVGRGPENAADGVAALLTRDGTLLTTWASGGALVLHRGLDPALPDVELHASNGPDWTCCPFNPALAVGGGGTAWIAWDSGAAGHRGRLVRPVALATGAPLGPPLAAPGRVEDADLPAQGASVAPRSRGRGVVTAYAATSGSAPTEVRLWTPGAPSALVVGHGAPSVGAVAVARDLRGRIWVAWTGGGPRDRGLRAVRSNPAGTRFGAVVTVGPPASGELGPLVTAPASDRLDVFLSAGAAPSGRVYHRALRPGLSVVLRTRPLPRRGRLVVVRVTDAGVPVRRAVVRFGGRVARTDRAGLARFRLAPLGGRPNAPRRFTLRVSRRGYVGSASLVTLRS